MDADLQDPPELIPRLIEKWREGYDVVYAVREQRGRKESDRRGQVKRMAVYSGSRGSVSSRIPLKISRTRRADNVPIFSAN
jgi:hypothetical protein